MARPVLPQAAVPLPPLLPWRRIASGHYAGAEMAAPAAAVPVPVLPSAFFWFESCFDEFHLLCADGAVPSALPGVSLLDVTLWGPTEADSFLIPFNHGNAAF